MSRWLDNRWLSIAVRIFLGAVLIHSAWPKLVDPPGFAQAIWNYRILPAEAINVAALLLSWLEFVAGLALISGAFRRGAALLAALMLGLFITAMALNVFRDLPVDCGCFSLGATGKSHDELISAMKNDIVRDSMLLLLSLQAMYASVTWQDPSSKMR